MQIGFVGLGKMGGNMVHRILRDSDHEVVALDFSAEASREAEGARRDRRRVARGPRRTSSRRRARCGSWSPPATRPQRRSTSWPSCSTRATRSSTAATRSGPTTSAAPRSSSARASTTSTSARRGGVWGLEVGYCMMVGGHDEAVERLAPILDVLAPAEEQAGLATSARPAPATT